MINQKECWFFNDIQVTCLEDLPNYPSLVGFCYKITNLSTGTIYIGKKGFQSFRKRKLSKKDCPTDQRRKKFEIRVQESDWQNYFGSSKTLKEDISKMGKDQFKREILELSCSKKHLTYIEVKHQILNQVIELCSYNENILGKFYAKDLHPCS